MGSQLSYILPQDTAAHRLEHGGLGAYSWIPGLWTRPDSPEAFIASRIFAQKGTYNL